MIELTLLIMKPVALLWLFVFALVGFWFGFGAFLLVLSVAATLCWWFWPLARRPRVVQAFEWQQFGSQICRMEVA